MNDVKQKSLLTDISSSKLRLPNIRKIRIDHISDGNKQLNSFFQNWFPSKIDMLSVNYYYKNPTGLKMGFYIDFISNAMKLVEKEIYLTWFEIKEPELEQIIKSASNWERLIFHYCDIHRSKKLDFGVSDKYKIKFLSFAYCGNTYHKERKSDWKSTPSSFKNIVEAISKSEFRYSLEQVDIYRNQTLMKDEVEAMLNELGMSHISVVEEGPLPIK